MCSEKEEKGKEMEREKEEREKQITVTVGVAARNYFSNYSYRRAPAGEFNIALQLPSGPSQELEM